MSDEQPDDEWAVSYKHGNKRLTTLHWESKDDGVNRRRALDHAARVAESFDVSELQVVRRPRTQWEAVDWKAELRGANSATEPYDEHKESYAGDRESG